jgi:hypothetical protein
MFILCLWNRNTSTYIHTHTHIWMLKSRVANLHIFTHGVSQSWHEHIHSMEHHGGMRVFITYFWVHVETKRMCVHSSNIRHQQLRTWTDAGPMASMTGNTKKSNKICILLKKRMLVSSFLSWIYLRREKCCDLVAFYRLNMSRPFGKLQAQCICPVFFYRTFSTVKEIHIVMMSHSSFSGQRYLHDRILEGQSQPNKKMRVNTCHFSWSTA